MSLTRSVTFTRTLQKGDIVQIPKLIREKFKLETNVWFFSVAVFKVGAN